MPYGKSKVRNPPLYPPPCSSPQPAQSVPVPPTSIDRLSLAADVTSFDQLAEQQESIVELIDTGLMRDSSSKAFLRELRKVIERSDVIIQVLDARDPEGTRSRWVEDEVRKSEGQGKKLLAVVNKIGQLRAQDELHLLTLNRPGPSSQSGSLAKIPAPLLPLHAVQVFDSEPAATSLPKQCSIITAVRGSRSNRHLAANPDHIIVSWRSCTTPPAQAVCSLAATYLPHSWRGRLSKCGQVVPHQLDQAEPRVCRRRHAGQDEGCARSCHRQGRQIARLSRSGHRGPWTDGRRPRGQAQTGGAYVAQLRQSGTGGRSCRTR